MAAQTVPEDTEMAEISSLVTSEVLGIPVKALSRNSKMLVPFAQLIGVFQLPRMYDASTLSRKRRSLGIADYYATSSELVLLRREKLIGGKTNKCLMVERGDAEAYIIGIVNGLRMTKEEFLDNIRLKTTTTTTMTESASPEVGFSDVAAAADDTEATLLESASDVVTDTTMESTEEQPSKCQQQSRSLFTEGPSTSEDSPMKLVLTQKSKRGRKKFHSDSCTSKRLTDEMKKLKEFYERPFNHERRGVPLSPATVKKTIQHIQSKTDVVVEWI